MRTIDGESLFGLQTTDENWQLAVIKEAAAVIFKVSASFVYFMFCQADKWEKEVVTWVCLA